MLYSNIFMWFLRKLLPKIRPNSIFDQGLDFKKSNPFAYRVNLVNLIRAGLTPLEVERYGNQLEC